MSVDRPAAALAIASFLRAIGHDPAESPELAATPQNVTQAFLDDLLSGYQVDVDALVREGTCPLDRAASADLVLVRDIAISSLCPHHLMPSLGTAMIAYIPGPFLLGLGTLTRLVDAFSRRLTLQEVIARQVADSLTHVAQARGAFCSITLRHTCLCCRGPRQTQATVLTEARSGLLSDEPYSSHLNTLLLQGRNH